MMNRASFVSLALAFSAVPVFAQAPAVSLPELLEQSVLSPASASLAERAAAFPSLAALPMDTDSFLAVGRLGELVAMAGGAGAASQVAKLTLLEADFSVMPHIVDEGRRVINNIRRAAALFLVKNIFSMGLALLTLVTGLRFPLESFHMSIVSSLTIGVPGFFLALEPNYARVRGSFLKEAIRFALPGGLTNILTALIAQARMASLGLPETDAQTITTAILCCVGLMVLYKVCVPFTQLRRLVWCAMTVCVVGAFFVLPPTVGYLTFRQSASYLVLGAMLLLAGAVFFLMNRLFTLADKLLKKTYM
jgi:cation-transporting ATPase E